MLVMTVHASGVQSTGPIGNINLLICLSNVKSALFALCRSSLTRRNQVGTAWQKNHSKRFTRQSTCYEFSYFSEYIEP